MAGFIAMAIPIPGRGSSRNCHGNGSVRLEYAGKKPIQDVLATPAGQFEPSTSYCSGTNRLYHADNLPVLAALLQEESVAGKVALVYLDPPFATAASFESRRQDHAYDDRLVGAEFIESLRERLILIHRLLADDGSLYLHLDDRMVFHLRVILDEIFGAHNFRNCITRKKCNPKNYTRKTYGSVADYILFYTKTDDYIWNRPFEPWDEARSAKEYGYVDERGRRYKKVPLHAPGVRHGETGKMWRGKLPPPGKHWQFTPAKLDDFDARGEIHWSSNGNPRRKVYLEGSEGVPLQNIWMDMRDAHNQNICITGYPTEKNSELLKRIIEASSHPGDLVLDAYVGSGTTVAEAAILGRRWIGIDRSDEAIKTTLYRLENGVERMGDFVNARASSPSGLIEHLSVCDFTLYEESKSTEVSDSAGVAASEAQALTYYEIPGNTDGARGQDYTGSS